jgi:xanthine dehydrogenase YagR molybdenum-binding subunit
MTAAILGKPANRVDGRAKVTGTAKYAAEYHVPGLAHGVVVSSAIAKGRIVKIDASEALAVPGVVQVFTHENAPRTAWFDRSYRDEIAPSGSPLRPLHDSEIVYNGQPIALVVAEEFEIARYAATLVRVEYAAEPHAVDLEAKRPEAYPAPKGKSGYAPPPPPRGQPEEAFANSSARIEAEYSTPVEHHNPMENYATTAVMEADGSLTVYDKTQGVLNCQEYLCKVFGLSADKVRVLSPYVGGAFGSGLRPVYQVFLAVMAATALKRSVRVSLTRPQMFTFTHRPETHHRIAAGATSDGWLESISHEVLAHTSTFEDYTEIIVNWSGLIYRCPNVKLAHKLAQLDVHTPADMRAPGATPGVYALECAMDELSYEVGADPLAFRLQNYAEWDQLEDKPFSSKELRACYKQGAEKFGWSQRTREPRSMRDGHRLVGWGVATGAWDAMQGKAAAKAILSTDGKLEVASATSDIGTGTYTVMTQIAAETLGLPMEAVTFKLGDTTLPMSPVEGGSWTVSSVGSAVKAVCEKVRGQLFQYAQKMDASPLAKARIEDVTFADGEIRVTADPIKAVTFAEAMRAGGVERIEEETASLPDMAAQSKFTMNTHSAVFVEVKVDEELGAVQVTRVVSAIAGGRILNPKTARSQIMGAVVWGIGMALEEESAMDKNLGRFMTHNLADYHFPVQADIHDIDVIFVEERDDIVNPLGAKGLGEIGLVGAAAAVANAIYHATGKRVRDLPITPDKLL